jgi:hypothetical protein
MKRLSKDEDYCETGAGAEEIEGLVGVVAPL